MPFQVSPGVNISEIDLTTVVPAVSTTEGALAGVFRWGPLDKRILIDTEDNLVARFGKPTNHNAETFFTAANFLSYGNKLYITRAGDTTDAANGVMTAYANTAALSDPDNALLFNVKNDDEIESASDNFGDETVVKYIARYPGELGNSLKISVCDSVDAFSRDVTLTADQSLIATAGSNELVLKQLNLGESESGSAISELASNFAVGNAVNINGQLLTVKSVGSVVWVNEEGASYITLTLTGKYTLANVTLSNTAVGVQWEYARVFDSAPGTSTYQSNFGANTSAVDELHVTVVDEDGKFTGVPGTILEAYQGLSRASDAKSPEGESIFVKDVINQNSKYVYYANDLEEGYLSSSADIESLTSDNATSFTFAGGSDGHDESLVGVNTLIAGYDLFKSAEDVDVSLVLQGKARGATLANHLIDNIAEHRKDCVAFISPEKADAVMNSGDEADDIIEFRNSLTSTSYAVIDSGYKYQYDKYNDVYRYIPLNGDVAGLCVRTDDTRDPWWSPAGFNRGIIKNAIKLAYNPKKADRDQLYKAGINPVVTFPGQGTLLFGDKTMLAKPSAFDRINVRRLFIVLEKAIATAAKFTLFEFNDDFTRSQFRNLVEPFLRDVQGRRGIYDFRVVCDETNNTGEVIDRNEFRGDIYIKPAKSINFIQLNFVAVRTGVEFSEVVGQF